MPRVGYVEDAPFSHRLGYECFDAVADETVADGGLTLALTGWRHFGAPVSLACYLQLDASERCLHVPLNAVWAALPYFAPDRELAHEPELFARQICEALGRARVARARTHHHQHDLRQPDWELACRRHLDRLDGQPLPRAAFIAIDRVGIGGAVACGSRPVLGNRISSRDAPTPTVLTPANGRCDDSMVTTLAAADICVLDVEDIRAPTARQALVRTLGRRAGSLPTLLIAQSPFEAATFLAEVGRVPRRIRLVADSPPAPDVIVHEHSRLRLQAEHSFRACVDPIRSASSACLPVIDAAWHAWREAQHVLTLSQPRPAYIEYRRHLEQLQARSIADARLFHAATAAIDAAAASSESGERAAAIAATVDAALNSSRQITVIVRSHGMASAFRALFASRWHCREDEVADLGISIVPSLPRLLRRAAVDTLIVAGYFGPLTIDAIFASRPRHLRLVLDPVEIRALSRTLRSARGLLNSVSPPCQIECLDVLNTAIASFVIHDGESIPVDFGVTGFSDVPSLEHAVDERLLPDAGTTLVLDDGTELRFDDESHLDVLSNSGRRLERRAAKDLQEGDTIIIVNDDYQRPLSQLILEALDRSDFRELARYRETWTNLLRSVGSQRVSTIVTSMRHAGVTVTNQRVRAWLHPEPDALSVQSTPRNFPEFRAFAVAIGLDLPEELVKALFQHIKQLRVIHQLTGRQLVRAMIAAALGRLHPASLQRFQDRLGGLDVKDLIEGTRLMTVVSTSSSV